MSRFPFLFFALGTCIILLFPQYLFSKPSFPDSTQDTFRVFFLGGQSNMDGFGINRELPDSLKGPMKDVWIFHGNTVPDNQPGGGLGYWQALQPGHGTGFYADEKGNHLSERFGPELSFAATIRHAFPGQKIAIIKYSKGGTSIDSLAAYRFGSWEPDYQGKNGINQYDHFLSTLQNARTHRDIDGNGTTDVWIPSGIVWMQGESDGALSEAVALKYFDNLKRLMDLVRAALGTDDLPVVIGKISDSMKDADGLVWDYGDLVQYGQEKYCRHDGHAAIVRSTQKYGYSDPWHYDTPAYIDLGKRMAEAMSDLLK